MFIFGGEDISGNSNELYTFNFLSFEWARVSVIGLQPEARSYHAFALIPAQPQIKGSHPRLAVFGGYSESGFTKELMIFDLVTRKWERPVTTSKSSKDGEPTPRQGSTMTYALDKLWIFGGFAQGNFYEDFHSLDLLSYSWEKLNDKIQG